MLLAGKYIHSENMFIRTALMLSHGLFLVLYAVIVVRHVWDFIVEGNSSKVLVNGGSSASPTVISAKSNPVA